MLEIDPGMLPDVLKNAIGELRPGVAVVLGSGFSGVADTVQVSARIPYVDLPRFPRVSSQVAGHQAELLIGSTAGVPVAVFSGRVHEYQGVTSLDAAYTARIAASLGCNTFIVTNAAGGVSDLVGEGEVMLIADQINLTANSPLIGWPGPEDGVPFVPMRDAFDPELRRIASEAANQQGLKLIEGVYAGVVGPAFETPAEVRYLKEIGADVVGMSTVPEVIAARALGMRVLGFSLVTNMAAGAGLAHEDVLEAGRRSRTQLSALLVAILSRL